MAPSAWVVHGSCGSVGVNLPAGRHRARRSSTTCPPEARLVARSTIVVMTDDGMDQMDPPSPKVVAALLREARSVSRRADKLGADVAAMQDPTIQELATQASSSIDQLVHQLMRLDQQAQRTRRATGHRAP